MIQPGLERITRLLAHTPLPWRAIHVAGTNGKGSVCTYISRMLNVLNKSQYFRTQRLPEILHGRFTSPHLIDRWDCITINDEPVSGRIFREVEQRVLARNVQEDIQASEFELLTATAFEIFTQLRVQVAVVEVGMGGREDATNILGQEIEVPANFYDKRRFRPKPIVSIITKIGVDHEKFLGTNIRSITGHKAGIIKPGVPVLYHEDNGIVSIKRIQKFAGKAGAKVACSSRKFVEKALNRAHHESHFHDSEIRPEDLVVAGTTTPLRLLPEHVHTNASMALSAAFIAADLFANLKSPNDKLIDEMLRAALGRPFPGRQQPLSLTALIPSRHAPVILDGAHNPASARALSAMLARAPRDNKPQHLIQKYKRILATTAEPEEERKPPPPNLTWVLAATAGRDAAKIFRPFLRPGDTVYVVEFGPVAEMPWVQAQSSEGLEDAVREAVAVKGRDGITKWRKITVHRFGTDILGALRAACAEVGEDPLVIAGSLYLAGDVLRLCRNAERHRNQRGLGEEMSTVDLGADMSAAQRVRMFAERAQHFTPMGAERADEPGQEMSAVEGVRSLTGHGQRFTPKGARPHRSEEAGALKKADDAPGGKGWALRFHDSNGKPPIRKVEWQRK